MEFYQAIQNRRTVRDFSEKAVPPETLEYILNAGLRAPTHNHRRDWEFVVLQSEKDKDNALQYVEAFAKSQEQNAEVSKSASPTQKMFAYAMPRQYSMLGKCPYVVLPFFKAGAGLLRSPSFSSLDSFASIWCVVENIFLAAAAEGLSCSMRIPTGDEGTNVAKAVGAPQDYMMPCYIGIGYAADDALILEQHHFNANEKTHYGTW